MSIDISVTQDKTTEIVLCLERITVTLGLHYYGSLSKCFKTLKLYYDYYSHTKLMKLYYVYLSIISHWDFIVMGA